MSASQSRKVVLITIRFSFDSFHRLTMLCFFNLMKGKFTSKSISFEIWFKKDFFCATLPAFSQLTLRNFHALLFPLIWLNLTLFIGFYLKTTCWLGFRSVGRFFVISYNEFNVKAKAFFCSEIASLPKPNHAKTFIVINYLY